MSVQVSVALVPVTVKSDSTSASTIGTSTGSVLSCVLSVVLSCVLSRVLSRGYILTKKSWYVLIVGHFHHDNHPHYHHYHHLHIQLELDSVIHASIRKMPI